MRSRTSLNILLLIFSFTFLTCVFLGLQLHYNNMPRTNPGCHYPTVGFKTFIHFYEPQDSTLVYAIGTTWRDTYDDILKKALPAHGFILLSAPSVNPLKTCHWKDIETVSVSSIDRGDISYQKVSRSAIQAQHMQPNEPGHPSNDTLTKIRNILLSNAPTYDILMFILICTLPFTGIALLLGPIWYIAHRRQKLSDAEGLDIELASINAPATPGQSTLDLELPEKLRVKDHGL